MTIWCGALGVAVGMRVGVCVVATGMVSVLEAVPVTAGPVGGVPVTVAVLLTEAASMSACISG